MDIAMVEGWEASALCCVVHMHPESTAWVEAKEKKSFVHSGRAKGKWKPKQPKAYQIILLSFK